MTDNERNNATTFLTERGFIVGERNPLINTDYPGKFMVCEAHEASELPTKDGSNGPWCIVGDNLDELIEQAYNVWAVED